jgi:hypothetical protein
MRRPNFFAIVLAASLPLLGCKDATSPAPPGSMSFNYAGSVHGSFAVTGSLNPDDYNRVHTGAIAQRGTIGERQQITVYASIPQPLQELSFTLIGVTGIGPVHTCQQATTNCVYQGYFYDDATSIHYFGWGVYSDPPYPEMNVTVTELTGSRIKGTFEGVVVGIGPDTLRINSGTFDVPFWK